MNCVFTLQSFTLKEGIQCAVFAIFSFLHCLKQTNVYYYKQKKCKFLCIGIQNFILCLSVYMLVLLRPTAPNQRAICFALLIFALVFMWLHLTCADDTNHCYVSGRDLSRKQDFYA